MVAVFHIREWLPKYSFEKNFAFDIISGVTVGMMAIPQSISYASIAGLPAQYGLYSDLQIMYPIFGTSKYLVVGPVAVMSLMARVALERIGGLEELTPEWIRLACLLSLIVALLQLCLAVLGLGKIISRLFPETVISGFASAAAMIIASTQISGLLGLNKCSSASGGSCSFPSTVRHVLVNIPNCQASAVWCSAICLFVLFSFKAKKFGSGIISNFGPLTVVTFSILYVRVFESIGGKDSISLAQVGTIPAGLPPVEIGKFQNFPSSINQNTLAQLFVSGVPIALIGFTEAITIAKTTAKVCDGELNSVHENNEMFALAACNAFTSWVGGYPVTGSFSRTAINAESGARSAISTAIAAVAVVVVLLFFTPYLESLPKPAVASIVISCVIRLIDVKEFFRLLHLWKRERNANFLVFCMVVLTSLTAGVENGLLAGVIFHKFLHWKHRNASGMI